MKLSEESFESSPGSVKDSDNDSKGTSIQARTLESTFKRLTTLSSKDVPTPTSKDSNIFEEDEVTVPPTTTIVPPLTSKSPKKALKKKQKKVRNKKLTNTFKPTNTPIPDTSSHHPTTSTPPPASKQVAKVTDVDHLTELVYDTSTVIGPRDTTEDDDLLALSNLKHENKIQRRRQDRKLRRLAMTREIQRIDFEDKLYLAKINKVIDTSRMDVTDCKKFVDLPFNGLISLTSFIDDLRTETMARQGWEKLASIHTKNSKTVQLLDQFNFIN